MTRKIGRKASAITAAFALATFGLAACGSDDEDTNGDAPTEVDSDALEAALEEGGELTYWTWTPSGEAQAEAFMEAYPNVTVDVVNAGTNEEQYTKLQNAIKAGSGAPDVAQIEYYAVPQFALTDSLLDLSQYGFGELEDQYTPGPWAGVTDGDSVYGLPQDSGPMALFYNEAIFKEAGIDEAPTTWEEFAEDAKTIHEWDDSVYITHDAGDAGFVTSMIWQAGGQPFSTTDGTNVSIDFSDEGTQKFTSMWDELIKDDLISPIAGWSNEWYQALNQGKIASLITGAWMPGNLISGVEDTAGDWRVAPMPTYDGTAANSENGGSAQAVVKQTENPELAAAFLKWLNNSEESIDIFLESGGFPSTTADLEDEEFLADAPEYFGGQNINEVLAQGATEVLTGWEYLPYQVYANSVFGDTVGKAYTGDTTLDDGLAAWQDSLVEYGSGQGFTVNE
ncbi:ABC transporter substrate-binding protein [Ancrocorticia populi]|uniref:ABC transporter substrate-binding protein n=1 Tax=Ancrocorticia populi TaxID=2175228 RepID=UPI003F9199AC